MDTRMALNYLSASTNESACLINFTVLYCGLYSMGGITESTGKWKLKDTRFPEIRTKRSPIKDCPCRNGQNKTLYNAGHRGVNRKSRTDIVQSVNKKSDHGGARTANVVNKKLIATNLLISSWTVWSRSWCAIISRFQLRSITSICSSGSMSTSPTVSKYFCNS